MSNLKCTPEGKDPILWQLAQKRASFKTHVISYLIVNIFLWTIWYLTGRDDAANNHDIYPWPIWTTLGWGVGLAFHFSAAYVFPKLNTTERKYEKLKHNQ